MDRRQFLAATVASAAASNIPAIAAEQVETVNVTINPREVTGPLPHIWEECVGSDRAAMTLRESWRQDIDHARAELGIKRVRFHGIFNDELGVFTSTTQRRNASPPNFRNVAEVYDGLVERKFAPFVELGFMPSELASGQSTFGFYKGNITPPKSIDAWASFIREFGVFLVERYGLEAVAQWPIEVWNEANLPFFWTGTQGDYFQLYKAAAVALKSISPRLQVGGPATSSTEWIPEFLAFCTTENAPVDFVSTHIYAGDNQQKLFGPGAKMSQNAVIPEAARRAKSRITSSALPKLPLYIDEWSSDSPAMIAHVLSGVIGQADMMSHWVLSGSYEELGPTDYVLQEGAMGWAQMVRGIPRPSYNTYRLLHALGDQRLHAEGPTLASRRSDGSVAALVWNLAEVVQPGGIPGANTKRDVVGSPKRVSITIPTMRPGQHLKVTHVDQERGSALSTWRKMGSPKIPTLRQLDILRRSAQLGQPEIRKIGRDGRIVIDLPAEGVALIET
jgi:xylan 1,4-beta-xylosidase